jgi:predicted ATPase
VASIIGKTFSFNLLEAVYPVSDSKEVFVDHISALRRLGIIYISTEPIFRNIMAEQVHGNLTFTFKDLLYMEVAYNMMLFEQKRQLHEEVAKWYEKMMTPMPKHRHRYPIRSFEALI